MFYTIVFIMACLMIIYYYYYNTNNVFKSANVKSTQYVELLRHLRRHNQHTPPLTNFAPFEQPIEPAPKMKLTDFLTERELSNEDNLEN